ncbi:MAG: hypothetical protein FJ267_04560 [Planctomycetes bacterium]|nr:hypothetical protein [Planctomycetota bacterium]
MVAIDQLLLEVIRRANQGTGTLSPPAHSAERVVKDYLKRIDWERSSPGKHSTSTLTAFAGHALFRNGNYFERSECLSRQTAVISSSHGSETRTRTLDLSDSAFLPTRHE